MAARPAACQAGWSGTKVGRLASWLTGQLAVKPATWSAGQPASQPAGQSACQRTAQSAGWLATCRPAAIRQIVTKMRFPRRTIKFAWGASPERDKLQCVATGGQDWQLLDGVSR